MQGAHENLFKSMALVHPSFFLADDADNVNAPVALIPSGGEDKDVMNAYWEKIQQKPIFAKSIRHDFVSSRIPICSSYPDPRTPLPQFLTVPLG